MTKRAICTSFWPVKNGIIDCGNWDIMDRLWTETYYLLEKQSEYHPVILTESSFNNPILRERTAEQFFETFQCPAFQLVNQGVLSLYSKGILTGISIDCGASKCDISALYEGHAVAHARRRFKVGGHDVTRAISSRIFDPERLTSHEIDISEHIKQSFLHVTSIATNILSSTSSPQPYRSPEVRYELPDGIIIDVPLDDLANSAESLFFEDTESTYNDKPTLPKTTFDLILSCDSGLQSLLRENMIIHGGTSLIRGFCSRLKSELQLIGDANVDGVVYYKG
ncbi:actin [Blyttiomyces sp. JEL0837]|nr:actin [Blyttiomyces sp. JEL0837]